jgi:hypothetical protein
MATTAPIPAAMVSPAVTYEPGLLWIARNMMNTLSDATQVSCGAGAGPVTVVPNIMWFWPQLGARSIFECLDR